MANTIKTLSDGDITRKALSILHNNLVFCKTINKQYDDRFARSGAKNGGTLLIREPNQFTIRTGAVMDTQDVTESTQTLTVATQKGVDINFSSSELTLSLDDFADRILKPAMTRLAAEVDKTVIAACYPEVYKYVQTTAGTAPVAADILKARAELQQGLAPTTDRHLMCGAVEANSIIASSATYYNPTNEISRQYELGKIGMIYGFNFWESEMVPVHTAGTRTEANTPTCSTTATSTAIANGVASVRMTLGLTSGTMTAGDVFIIADVHAVNPETKATCSWLQQWSVTAATNVTATSYTVPVSPTPYRSGAKQNIAVIVGTVSALVYVSGSVTKTTGVASAGAVNSLAYHRDAFTMVTADLEMPRGTDMGHREVYDGISMRLVRDFDITNDKFPCRIDVLFGQKCIRPEWACRVAT